MADKIIYYAITDEVSNLSRPAGVLRRTQRESGGKIDEVFSGQLNWIPSPLLVSAEHGDIANDFTEISAAEAERIVARIRAGAPYDA